MWLSQQHFKHFITSLIFITIVFMNNNIVICSFLFCDAYIIYIHTGASDILSRTLRFPCLCCLEINVKAFYCGTAGSRQPQSVGSGAGGRRH